MDTTTAVLAAIEQQEAHNRPSHSACSNDTIAEATGLSLGAVADTLGALWKADRIEGILTWGGDWPSLVQIRLVLPGRPRELGREGYYTTQPG
jgi:hypothetical protein